MRRAVGKDDRWENQRKRNARSGETGGGKYRGQRNSENNKKYGKCEIISKNRGGDIGRAQRACSNTP